MSRLRSFLMVLGVVHLAAGTARAEGTACGSETILVPDGRMQASTIPNTTTFFFAISTRVGNAYSVEFMNPVGPAPQTPGTVAVFSDAGCSVPLTSTTTTGNDPKMSLNGVRVSFTATTTTTRITLNNNTGSPVNYTFSASDTTLYSPAWTTNGTYATYYSFYNTTSSPITGTITLNTTTGGSAGTTNLTINPGQTASTNTVALSTPPNQTGTAKFTHDGPPAGILVEADVANFTLNPPYVQPVKFQAVREIR